MLTLVVGRLARVRSPLVRIHSRCDYGEALHSLDCDCSGQLAKAMAKIARERVGVLVYLDQEGRGHGLEIKGRALQLKDHFHWDTEKAFRRMKLKSDIREYDDAVRILNSLGVRSARILTNNPKKIEALERAGIKTTRVPLTVAPNEFNIDYLRAKRDKFGQWLGRLRLARAGKSSLTGAELSARVRAPG